MPTREELMVYCRVDDEAQGDLLVSLARSAQEYLSSAGIRPSEDNYERYGLAIKALTLHYLDNPVPGSVPAGVQSIINQLKLTATM